MSKSFQTSPKCLNPSQKKSKMSINIQSVQKLPKSPKMSKKVQKVQKLQKVAKSSKNLRKKVDKKFVVLRSIIGCLGGV